MLEIAIALVLLGVVAASGLLLVLAGFWPLLTTGSVLVGAGMLLGIPFGVVYHLQLYRALARRGELRRGWWLHPTALHPPVGSPERPTVMPWFYAGAISVGVAFAGCAALLLALLAPA